MNSVERVMSICKERDIPISRLEKDLGFANGYISQLRKGVFPADRLAAIANYFGVTSDYLLTGEQNGKAPTSKGKRVADVPLVLTRKFYDSSHPQQDTHDNGSSSLASAISASFQVFKEKVAPDFEKAANTAHELLITQSACTLPVDVEKLVYKQQIMFSSYGEYFKLTGVDVLRLSDSSDGFTTDFGDGENYLVLYNENVISSPRKRWTLAHEVGHILLGHKDNGEREEIEAHFFASELLMPIPVLKELISRGVTINQSFLCETFGVSMVASDKRIETLKRALTYDKQSNYSDLLKLQFTSAINKIAPPQKDDFLDALEMQQERDRW